MERVIWSMTFRSTAETILHEFHARQNDHPDSPGKLWFDVKQIATEFILLCY